ncbi:NADH-quinone oxidoreductase subunit L [Pseudonocardia sp. K10HN5]|uniref:NADH-quinone oxidoreductase subunit L n=1 Tax=Pseudonocardia acidicola TaxID=2724939 RepID=A0ABX1SB46_9PSEU|nr:NADH-quinone oxidoreductase subunit L [Pseudonocardia acidicola]
MALATCAVLVPFLAAALGLLAGRRSPGGPAVVAVTGATGCAVLAVLVASGAGAGPAEAWVPFTPTGGIPIVLGARVDALSATVGVMVGVVALAVQVYSAGLMRGRPRYASFSALISLFTAAMLTVVFSADLLIVYVGWEVMGVCSYLLIGHHWEDRPTTAAALKAFLMTRVGDVGLLFGIVVLGLAAGSFRITAVLDAVPGMSPGPVLAGTLLITLGVVAKSGQFPLHSWLPDAMAGPAPVSALIHAATMVAAGVVLVVRLYPAFLAAPVTLAVLGVLAAITMLGAALAALGAEDLKRVLAYSTVSQLGLMFGALAAGGATAALTHLLAHAAFKALLFLAAGAVAVAVGGSQLSRMGGLRRGMPVTFATATVGFAALAALPPTSGFVSKDGVVDVMWHGRGPVATILLGSALLTTAVTGAYVTRAWLRTFAGPVREPGVREVPALLTGPLVALAVPALGLGVYWVTTGALRVDRAVALTCTGFALAGVVAGYLGWRRAPAWSAPRVLATAFGTDDLYERTLVPVVQRLATRVVRADDGVGAAVRGTGNAARRLGGALRLTQTGNPQFYVTGVLAGVLLIAVGVAMLG